MKKTLTATQNNKTMEVKNMKKTESSIERKIIDTKVSKTKMAKMDKTNVNNYIPITKEAYRLVFRDKITQKRCNENGHQVVDVKTGFTYNSITALKEFLNQTGTKQYSYSAVNYAVNKRTPLAGTRYCLVSDIGKNLPELLANFAAMTHSNIILSSKVTKGE